MSIMLIALVTAAGRGQQTLIAAKREHSNLVLIGISIQIAYKLSNRGVKELN